MSVREDAFTETVFDAEPVVRRPVDRVPDGDGAFLCVLASGSGGNCSALVTRRGSVTRICLIDLGLSPRRTFRRLAEAGLRPDQIDHAIVTHLDTDHLYPGWMVGFPAHATLRLHKRHARDLIAMGWGEGEITVRPFDAPGNGSGFDLEPGVHVRPFLASHDESGTTTLRIDLPGFGGGALGFATDVGHVTMDMVEHFRADHADGVTGPGLDVLAIESNYCPRMQLASDRPIFLKNRIMGGRGHLSNQQAVEAIHAIQPREHVVFLHLSRQCNDPALLAGLHEGADYAWTITDQFNPTRWIRLAPSARPNGRPVVSARLLETATLWSS